MQLKKSLKLMSLVCGFVLLAGAAASAQSCADLFTPVSAGLLSRMVPVKPLLERQKAKTIAEAERILTKVEEINVLEAAFRRQLPQTKKAVDVLGWIHRRLRSNIGELEDAMDDKAFTQAYLNFEQTKTDEIRLNSKDPAEQKIMINKYSYFKRAKGWEYKDATTILGYRMSPTIFTFLMPTIDQFTVKKVMDRFLRVRDDLAHKSEPAGDDLWIAILTRQSLMTGMPVDYIAIGVNDIAVSVRRAHPKLNEHQQFPIVVNKLSDLFNWNGPEVVRLYEDLQKPLDLEKPLSARQSTNNDNFDNYDF